MTRTRGAHARESAGALGAARDAAFAAGLALMLFLALDVLLGSALLIFGVPIGAWLAPASALLAGAGTVALSRRTPPRRVAAGLAAALFVVLLAVSLSLLLYDVSYDGNSYQKTAIGALANGWNPVWESIGDYWARAPLSLPPITHALWADCYPKASWVFGASVYLLTGSVESAKCINLIAAAALALVAFDYLSQRFLTGPRAALCAALLAVNPISLPQLFTCYVDGLLASVLICIVVALAAQADPGYDRRGHAPWTLVAAAVLVCVNIKFTGLVYAAFFCASFWALELLRARGRARAGEAGALGRTFARRTGYYLAVVAVSVLVAGSNSYVVNAVRHGSPFYPLISSQQVDIIRGYQPDSFEDMNPYEQWARSLLSRTENLWKDPVTLKAPFTASADELSVSGPDTRRAGFGAFFSGAFLASLAVGVAVMVRLWRGDRALLANVVATAVPSALLIGLTDGSWWARYTPYLWVVPVAALAALLAPRRAGRLRRASLLTGAALAAVLVTDVATFAPSVAAAARGASEMRSAVEAARASGGPVEACLSEQALGGVAYNLWDAGVDYVFVTRSDGGEPLATVGYAGLSLY